MPFPCAPTAFEAQDTAFVSRLFSGDAGGGGGGNALTLTEMMRLVDSDSSAVGSDGEALKRRAARGDKRY